MAIQPIDLQTLFTQVEKVGKTQSAEKEGLALQQAMRGVRIERKNEENIQSVNETQNTGDGTEKVKDRESGSRETDRGGGKRRNEDEEPAEEKTDSVIRDPVLGRNIDISL